MQPRPSDVPHQNLGIELISKRVKPDMYPGAFVEVYAGFSTITGAGAGLFSGCFIAKSKKIGEYRGALVFDGDHPIDNGYMMVTHYISISEEKVCYIDGYLLEMNTMGFANHAKRGTRACNMMARELQDGRVHFYAKRDILPGEELCFEYNDTIVF